MMKQQAVEHQVQCKVLAATEVVLVALLEATEVQALQAAIGAKVLQAAREVVAPQGATEVQALQAAIGVQVL